MSAKFYLRERNKPISSLQVIIRFHSDIYKFSTGIKVETKYWNQARQRLKESPLYPDAYFINQAIIIQEKKYNDVLHSFISKQFHPSQNEFKKKIDEYIDSNNPKSSNNDLFLPFVYKTMHKLKAVRSSKTFENYESFYNKMLEYETKHKLKLTFSDFNKEMYLHFRKWFYELDHSINYYNTMMKMIRTFMNIALDEDLIKLNDFKKNTFKKDHFNAENIYLSTEELLKIHYLDFSQIPEFKNPLYNLAKNKFLIGAFTGLRVSDFNRLKKMNISDNFIKIVQHKTERPVIVPIHWVVKEILNNGFDINEKISDDYISVYIKKICEKAEINTPILYHLSKGGVIKETQLPKYKLVSSHTARRSFATNAFKAGVPTISIMKITGHRSETSFMKYIKITEEENAILMSNHAFFLKKS